MGLILDTSILIFGERQGRRPEHIFQHIQEVHGEIDVSISVLSIVELDHGIYRARSAQQAEIRRQFSLNVSRLASILPINLDIARLAGQVEGQQAALGFAIPLADLLIGCTALHFGDSVLTYNTKHFNLIPNLKVLTL